MARSRSVSFVQHTNFIPRFRKEFTTSASDPPEFLLVLSEGRKSVSICIKAPQHPISYHLTLYLSKPYPMDNIVFSLFSLVFAKSKPFIFLKNSFSSFTKTPIFVCVIISAGPIRAGPIRVNANTCVPQELDSAITYPNISHFCGHIFSLHGEKIFARA
jgi:hypothetical protein